jgi:hypothetical protein
MKKILLILSLLLILMFSGCVQEQINNDNFTDKEILDLVYSDYKVPEGFFQDVLETGINPNFIIYEQLLKDNKLVFYCANDFNSAELQIKENIDEYNQKYNLDTLSIAEIMENEKFFEFRTVVESPTGSQAINYLRYRVYKCNYIDDLQNQTDFITDDIKSKEYIGRYVQRPITQENVSELIEFLWYSGFGNNVIEGSKVLVSATKDYNTSVKHTIYELETSYGDWSLCDNIVLIKSEYDVDKNSGEITLSQEKLKTIKGKCN